MQQITYGKERGEANYGWLKAKYSFSFGNYFDKDNMHFGPLRVLNNDIIDPSRGFDTHPHKNMEIITIPLSGELLHQDSTGAKAVLKPGQVQVMSAGSGIKHSEHNNSEIEPLELFQIWIIPDKENIPPRHDEQSYTLVPNKLTILAGEGGIPIQQDAKVGILQLTEDYVHKLNTAESQNNGIFIMVIEGEATINNNKLQHRDAIKIWDEDKITITETTNAKLLWIQVRL